MTLCQLRTEVHSLKSSNTTLARALDLEICLWINVFVLAIAGLFYFIDMIYHF
jgi:hypothetical protein